MFHGIWQVLGFGIYKAERILHAKRMEVEFLISFIMLVYSMEQSLNIKPTDKRHISPHELLAKCMQSTI
jgi:hypothetical protein